MLPNTENLSLYKLFYWNKRSLYLFM